MERRLAAIISTDVVGYSRLIRADEEGTLAALKALRTDLIEPKLAEHHGRIVKLMGDGMLAEFPSVVDAVRAAVETQIAVAKHNAVLPEDKRIEFRVGINLGDVVIDGDDIQGDGVNIAARLEGIAPPGGICISEMVYEGVRDRIDTPFKDLGEKEVKNIDRPIRVWQWTLAEFANTTVAEAPLSTPDKPSIAVLPFANISGDPEQEYFADGMTEDIITILSRLRWLYVIARNSTFQFKGSARDIRQIGRDLNVRYVLEGSVRRAGSRVRISAQLIDTSSGSHLWAEHYDREMVDIFDLQDDVARQISACLAPEIERAEWRGLGDVKKPSLNTWHLYLRGLAQMHEYNRAGNIAATEYFRQVIDLESEFAGAYAGMAYVIYHDINNGDVPSRERALRKAERYAQQAITLDDQDAFGHCVLGRIYSIEAKFEDAITEQRIALRLNPSFALAYHGLGYALLFSGATEESIPQFEMAEMLSPHDHNVWAFLSIRAIAYSQLGNHEVAVSLARQAIRKPHAKFWAWVNLLSTLGHTDRSAETEEIKSELLRQKSDIDLGFVQENMDYYKHPEKFEYFLNGLRRAGLPE